MDPNWVRATGFSSLAPKMNETSTKSYSLFNRLFKALLNSRHDYNANDELRSSSPIENRPSNREVLLT